MMGYMSELAMEDPNEEVPVVTTWRDELQPATERASQPTDERDAIVHAVWAMLEGEAFVPSIADDLSFSMSYDDGAIYIHDEHSRDQPNGWQPRRYRLTITECTDE